MTQQQREEIMKNEQLTIENQVLQEEKEQLQRDNEEARQQNDYLNRVLESIRSQGLI